MDIDVDNVVIHVEFDMGKQRYAPNMSTQEEGPLTTFTSATTFTSETIRAPSMAPHPSSTNPTTGLIAIPQEFLQHLVECQYVTDTRLGNVETKLASSYGNIWPLV